MPDTIAPGDGPFAHSLTGLGREHWEPLLLHSTRVGERAGAFAAAFGAREAGTLAGYLHDIGKVSPAFQAYIDGRGPSPDHSTAGAVVADALFPAGGERLIARLAALAIAGHHAGLADGTAFETRLTRPLEDYSGWRAVVPPLPAAIAPRLPGGSRNDPAYRLAFLGRMLFSCLVDADFLETERFYAEAGGTVPQRGGHAPLAELRERLDAYMAPFADRPGALNARRAAILAHARAKAALPPGLFTMTVPTGGGKTLASLAFALDHAVRHGLSRVIYVIPYTGAWIETPATAATPAPMCVAPHAGAWIETPACSAAARAGWVAPHAGAWIETRCQPHVRGKPAVAPHAGAWIETSGACRSRGSPWSPLTRKRGSKHRSGGAVGAGGCYPSDGGVDRSCRCRCRACKPVAG